MDRLQIYGLATIHKIRICQDAGLSYWRDTFTFGNPIRESRRCQIYYGKPVYLKIRPGLHANGFVSRAG